jgi:NADPH:quinone reductase-like Zn-dependent oxidoreductase
VVRVRGAALHRIVRVIAAGKHYLSNTPVPFVPGIDGVGTLEDGTRVYFSAPRAPFGSMAERSVVAREHCIALPPEIDDVMAAAAGNPAMSSWVALTVRTTLRPGERVLVVGATGVAGKLALRIARYLGAGRVVAAARNRTELERLLGQGADATVPLDLDHDALVAALRAQLDEGIDVVLDYVWGPVAEALLDAIATRSVTGAPRIRYVEVGSLAAPAITLQAATLRSSGVEILGTGFGSAPMDRILRAIGEFFEAARTTPFPIDARAVALRDVAAQWNLQSPARTVFVP